jgi:hypothetical protein
MATIISVVATELFGLIRRMRARRSEVWPIPLLY